MIYIDPVQLLVAPLLPVMAILFMMAWLYDLKTFRRRKRKDETIYRCTNCHRIYTEIHRIPLRRCPECDTLNEPIPRR